LRGHAGKSEKGLVSRASSVHTAFAPALEEAFSLGGLHMVTVPIDYSENVRVLVDELKHMQV
jgi:acetolactate synthase-1/2/3 large subunit